MKDLIEFVFGNAIGIFFLFVFGIGDIYWVITHPPLRGAGLRDSHYG